MQTLAVVAQQVSVFHEASHLHIKATNQPAAPQPSKYAFAGSPNQRSAKWGNKNLFWYVTVLIVGIFFFSGLALAQEEKKMEISKQPREKIIAFIKEEELVDFIKVIIRAGQPDAENPLDLSLASGKEEGIAQVVADELRAMGINVQLHAEIPGRPNVVGFKKGSVGKPSLILNDHLDAWPPINEFIDLDQAMIATKTYALAIARILGIRD